MRLHEAEPTGSSFEQWVMQRYKSYSSTKIQHVNTSEYFYITSFDHGDMEFTYKKKGERVDFSRNYCAPAMDKPNAFDIVNSLTLETEYGVPRMVAFGPKSEDGKSNKSIRVYDRGYKYYSETNVLRALRPGWKGNLEYRNLEVEYRLNGSFESMRFFINFPYLDNASSVEFVYLDGRLQRKESDYHPSKFLGLVTCDPVPGGRILFQRSTHEGAILDEIPIPLRAPVYSISSLVPEGLLANPIAEDPGVDLQWRTTSPSGLVGIRWNVIDRYDRQAA